MIDLIEAKATTEASIAALKQERTRCLLDGNPFTGDSELIRLIGVLDSIAEATVMQAQRERAANYEAQARQRKLIVAEIERLNDSRIAAARACQTAADNLVEAINALMAVTGDVRVATAKLGGPVPMCFNASTLKARIADRFGEIFTGLFGGHEFATLSWRNHGGKAKNWEFVEAEISRADILRLTQGNGHHVSNGTQG
jgi:hypothetical protein